VTTDPAPRPGVLVIGVGSPDRGDDAAGRIVARRLAGRPDPAFTTLELGGDAMELMDAWEGAPAVVVVDAVVSGATAGTIGRFDASSAALPAEMACASTHDIGLAEAIELSRAMGSLPPRVVVMTVEGERFTHGPDLSPAVRDRIDTLAEAVRAEAASLAQEVIADA